MTLELVISSIQDKAAVKAPGDTIQIQVQLDGETHQLEAAFGQVVLDALEDAGIDAPYSCRSGSCAACMCKLTSGTVELIENHVLDENDLAEGWILGCQAMMQSDIDISYPD